MKDIFNQLRSDDHIQLTGPEFFRVNEIVDRSPALPPALNAAMDIDEVREKLSEIIPINKSTTIFAPFYTSFCRFIKLGKHITAI